MANTIIQIDLPDSLSPVLAILTAAESGLVAPNAAGYAISAGAESWQFTITVAEACVGIYRCEVQDGDGVTIAMGWVWIEVDDTSTYVADGSFISLMIAKRFDGILDELTTQGDTNQSLITTVDTVVDAIKLKTDLIGTLTAESVQTSVEGASSGEILINLFIGDDYTGARKLAWTVPIPDGTTVGGSTCKLKFVQSSGECTPFEIEFTGTIVAATAGYATVSFAFLKAETATITEGEYFFYVTWIGDGGEVITKVYNRQIVQWKAKEL